MRLLVVLFFSLTLTSAIFSQNVIPEDVKNVMSIYNCGFCHHLEDRAYGPSWQDIAKKNYKTKRFINLVYKPEPQNWKGYPPMTELPFARKEDLTIIANWVKTLK